VGRISVEAAHFFENVPAAGEAYVLSHIIHDWLTKASCTKDLGIPSIFTSRTRNRSRTPTRRFFRPVVAGGDAFGAPARKRQQDGARPICLGTLARSRQHLPASPQSP
jgi:hypothetical protein